jgi:hypothetical protein
MTSATDVAGTALAAGSRVLTVGASPVPMAGVVAVKVAVKVAVRDEVKDVMAGAAEAAGDEANAPDQASAIAWTPMANRPPMMA